MFVWGIRMLQYEIIAITKECMLSHYWYFKDFGCKFISNICNKCHDVLMTAYEL